MTLQFNKKYFIASIVLFFIEVIIATFLTHGFIRHTFGDFLVVILIYCFFRSFIEIKPGYLAIIVLIIAFTVEFLQLTNFIDILGLEKNKIAKIVIGSTFQIQDLIAYTLGVIMILIIDFKTQ